MMRNKANCDTSELLGHACLTTTQVYTSVTIADLKEAHQNTIQEKGKGINEAEIYSEEGWIFCFLSFQELFRVLRRLRNGG